MYQFSPLDEQRDVCTRLNLGQRTTLFCKDNDFTTVTTFVNGAFDTGTVQKTEGPILYTCNTIANNNIMCVDAQTRQAQNNCVYDTDLGTLECPE